MIVLDLATQWIHPSRVTCGGPARTGDVNPWGKCALSFLGGVLIIIILRTLHVGSWFSLGQLTSAVKYGLGGRQGCKVGATMFDGAWDISLTILNSSLEADGLALKLNRVGDAFWMSPSDEMLMLSQFWTLLSLMMNFIHCDHCTFCLKS